MEYTLATHDQRAGAIAGHVCFGGPRLRREGRILRGSRVRHITGSLYFYALSDPRHCGWLVDGAERAVLFDFHRAGKTVALGLLGICGDLCLECADQEPDRLGVSVWSYLFLSAGHAKLAAYFETEAGFEHDRVSCHCRALACVGGVAESPTGSSEGFSLVLFCE